MLQKATCHGQSWGFEVTPPTALGLLVPEEGFKPQTPWMGVGEAVSEVASVAWTSGLLVMEFSVVVIFAWLTVCACEGVFGLPWKSNRIAAVYFLFDFARCETFQCDILKNVQEPGDFCEDVANASSYVAIKVPMPTIRSLLQPRCHFTTDAIRGQQNKNDSSLISA